MNVGPDAGRYLIAGRGDPVAFPFNLRWLLPTVCRTSMRRWWIVWMASWPLLAAGAAVWAFQMGATWWEGAAVAAFLTALPGVLQPSSTHPVGVDLPAMAVAIWAAAAFAAGWWPAAVVLVLVAALIKEHAPIWVALWAWTPWALVGLVAVAVVWLVRRPAIDEVTAIPLLRRVHDHPIRSAFEHHRRHGYRNAWFMVAPWGVTLAALLAPSPQLVVTVVVAYAALLVATDTVRVYQPIAGPVVCLAAVSVIPTVWLLPAVVFAAVWWRDPVTG